MSCGRFPIVSKNTWRASVYPLVCRPIDGSPSATSPAAMRVPSTIFARSTTPTIVPATSYSPAA